MEKEADILAMLKHENIIEFYGTCYKLAQRDYSLIIELAPYGSLYSFLQSPDAEKMNSSVLLNWSRHIARGVQYLHNEAPCKVIHRDLKSKNVVISSDHTLKLCDFGASRFMAQTQTMTLVGTFPWMAPEVIQGLKSNESCDIYSFGVLMWEMLTKEVPFKGQGFILVTTNVNVHYKTHFTGMEGFQVAWMVVEKRQRPPIPESAPDAIRNLITSCWEHDPKKRQDVGSVIKVLDKLNSDPELEREANQFMLEKDDWEDEYEDLMDSLRTEQHSSASDVI